MRQIRVCNVTEWKMLNSKIIDVKCSSLSDVCVFSLSLDKVGKRYLSLRKPSA